MHSNFIFGCTLQLNTFVEIGRESQVRHPYPKHVFNVMESDAIQKFAHHWASFWNEVLYYTFHINRIWLLYTGSHDKLSV